MTTASTRLPTGTKKRNHITPFSALLHRLPKIDLLIIYKAEHSLSPATYNILVHALMNIAPPPPHPPPDCADWSQGLLFLTLKDFPFP